MACLCAAPVRPLLSGCHCLLAADQQLRLPKAQYTGLSLSVMKQQHCDSLLAKVFDYRNSNHIDIPQLTTKAYLIAQPPMQPLLRHKYQTDLSQTMTCILGNDTETEVASHLNKWGVRGQTHSCSHGRNINPKPFPSLGIVLRHKRAGILADSCNSFQTDGP